MYAELPYRQYEQLLEVIEKMQHSRKKSFARKARRINITCVVQNQLRQKLVAVKPSTMRAIEDNYTGVDYIYNQTSIDQKFSFGDLGENAIIIRTKDRRLLNASDWTMIINRNEEVELFETKKLAEFVKRNWGTVQKNLIEKNEHYEKYKVQVSELYRAQNVQPIIAELTEDKLFRALSQVTRTKPVKQTLPKQYLPIAAPQ